MSKKSNDDEYYTPRAAIEMLKSALIKSRFPPNKKKINKIYRTSPKSRKKVVVWECFGCDFDYIESPKLRNKPAADSALSALGNPGQDVP